MSDQPEFDNGQPYCGIAGECVADAIALLHLVCLARPDVPGLPNRLIVNIDASTSVLTVGIRLEDDRVMVVERIAIDANLPQAFGSPIDAAAEPRSTDDKRH